MPTTRSIVRLMMTAALATTLGQPLLSGAAPAAAAGKASVIPNSDFEKGTTGWVTGPKSKVKLSTGAGRTKGNPALRAVAKKRTALKVQTRTVVNRKVRKGVKHRWSVWVRTDKARTIRLAVKERRDGRTVKTKSQTRRVTPGTWRQVSATSTRRHADSKLRLVITSAGLKRGEKVLVDQVRVWPVATTPTASAKTDPVAGELSNGCTFTTRGLPSCGAYLGMAYGSNTDPSTIERDLGGPLGVRRTYYRADQVDSALRTAKADVAKGRLPWVSFKFPHSWEQMASGKGDAWAKKIANGLAAVDGPVWVAFHHEPEGDGDIQAWRKAQERLAPIVRNAGNNIGFTVVLTGWHQFYGPSEYSLANIWPRKVTVDVAGFDIYNSHGVVKSGKTMKPTDMDGAYFAKIEAWAEKQGVAWGLAETGYTDAAAKEDPNWIRRTLGELDARGGVAMAYFNTSLNSIAPWTLGNQTKLDAYRAAQLGTPRLPLP